MSFSYLLYNKTTFFQYCNKYYFFLLIYCYAECKIEHRNKEKVNGKDSCIL